MAMATTLSLSSLSSTLRIVQEKVSSLQELVSLSLEQLEDLLGNSSNASLLFSFLHSSPQPQD